MTNIYDFTITSKPAYPDTSVEAREARERKEQKKAREIREIRERTGMYKSQAKKKTKADTIRELRNQAKIAETLLKY